MKKKYYSIDELLGSFQLLKTMQCEELEKWKTATYELNAFEQELLHSKHLLAVQEVDYWNEEELKMQFISATLDVANLNVKGKIKTFFERMLSATVNDILLSVKCDCMVASPLGINTPVHPYFFLQEYKKGKGDKYDPEAQMLAAMLIAQQVNNDNMPLYGSWVMGRLWFFATLIDHNYCTSSGYDATDWNDLLQIVFFLRHLKELISNR